MVRIALWVWIATAGCGWAQLEPAVKNDTMASERSEQAAEVPKPLEEASDVGRPVAPYRALEAAPSLLDGGSKLPDAIFLRDASGQPIFVPRARYEEFEAFLRERTGRRESGAVDALLEETRVTGHMQPGYAELQFEFTLSITDPKAKFVQIPLGLHQINWIAAPKTQGGSKSFIRTSTPEEGIVWYLEPDGSPKYRLILNGVLQTSSNALEKFCLLALPSSATRIEVAIPGNDLEVEWRGAAGEVLEIQRTGQATKAIVRGRGGNGRLAWREPNALGDFGAVEVESKTRFSRDGEGENFRAISRVRVISDSRSGTQNLTIRLPDGARWIPSKVQNPSWRLTPLEVISESQPAKKPLQAPKAQLGFSLSLEFIDRNRALADEVLIEWVFEPRPSTDGRIPLSTLQVDEAQRHDARVEIVLPVATRFSWLPNTGWNLVRQSLSSEVANSVEYEFRVQTRASELQGRLAEREIRSRLQPDYVVRFGNNELTLDGVVTLVGEQSSLAGLEIFGDEWQIRSIVDDKSGAAIPYDAIGTNRIRLSPEVSLDEESAEAAIGSDSKSLRVLATKPHLKSDSARFVIQLPVFQWPSDGATRTEHGEGLIVLDQGEWQIRPAELQTVGMVKTTELPNSLQALIGNRALTETLAYRFQADGPAPRLNGRMRKTPRVVSTTLASRVQLSQTHWLCTRRWTVSTQGPRLDTVTLRVPFEWINRDEESGMPLLSKDVVFSSQGRRYATQVVSVEDEAHAIVELVESQWSSSFEIELSYRGDYETAAGTTSEPTFQTLRVPLPNLELSISPLVYSSRVELEVGSGIRCRVSSTGQSPMMFTAADGVAALDISADSTHLDLEVAKLAVLETSKVEIDRMWLQSVINRTDRRDRFVVRLTTHQSFVRFKLPASWSGDSVRVLVDGSISPIEQDPDEGLFRVYLPYSKVLDTHEGDPSQLIEDRDDHEAKKPLRHTLEFFEWTKVDSGWMRQVAGQVPTIMETGSIAPLLWQIVIPSHEYLWSQSASLLPNQRWVWKNIGWRRVNDTTQADIEAEIGVGHQPALPASTNQYLFTLIGSSDLSAPVIVGDLRIVSNYILWLPVTGIALLLTALWPRLGFVRHPWMLLVVVAMLYLVGSWAPDAAMLLTQAAFGSLLIVASVALMRWILAQGGNRRTVLASRTTAPVTARPNTRAPADDSKGSRVQEGVLRANPPSQTTHTLDHAQIAPPSETL